MKPVTYLSNPYL